MGAKSQIFSFSPPQNILLDQITIDNQPETPSSAEPKSISIKYYNIREIHREALAATAVMLAQMNPTGEKVAIKKIFKDCLVNEFLKAQAKQECQFHESFDHPNIVKVLEYWESDQDFSIVMEFVDNPTFLKDKIETNLMPIEEEENIKSYVKDILEALVYLHSKGIVHGDLKLENLLLKTIEEQNEEESKLHPSAIKICDFGLSRTLDKDTKKSYMEFAVGSKSYMAPEMKDKCFVDEKIDMWALGIIMYKMAVAYKPTQIPGYKTYTQPVPFRRVDWKNRSEELQDLVAQLLALDPAKRISAVEALQHPWFNKNC